MTTLIIPNTLQISAHFLAGGQDLYNVLHFRYPDGTFINAQDTLTTFKTAWEKAAGPHKLKPTAVTMVEYRLTDLSSATGVVATLGSNTAGGVTGSLSALSNSCVMKLTSGTRSRSGAGRVFHGPLISGDVSTDGRTVLSASRAAFETAYRTLMADMKLANLTLVVASRKNSTATDVLQINAAPIVASQRRRLR